MRLTGNVLTAGVALVVGVAIGGPRSTLAAQADQGFVQEAASAGQMEVELGRHASRHAADPQVKRFGERMMNDHRKANIELAGIADRESIPLSSEPSATHEATIRRLTALKGRDFDREYMKAMVEDHEEDVAKFREVARSAETPRVKEFAQKTLPTLQEHLKIAKEIYGRMEKHVSASHR
jgi:putative membrane protein